MHGQHTAEPTAINDPGDAGVAAHQAQSDAAAAALLGFVGQNGERAAAHKIKAIDVDDEWTWRGGDCGRLPDRPAPGVLVGGVDLIARVDYHHRSVALGGCP